MTPTPETYTRPKIGALAPWFGGKRTMAAAIVEELGPHSAYWEPFCGGCSVLLAKPPSSHETINDLHGDLINLARVIAQEDTAVELYGRLARVLFDEERREESRLALRKDIGPVDRAYHWMIVEWFGRNGFSGTKSNGVQTANFSVRWNPGGGAAGVRWSAAVDSIPEWHQRLRRVVILRRNARGVLESIADVPGVVIYLDPPYVVKDAEYFHDFTDGAPSLFGTDADDALSHEELAQLAGRFKHARVVVSYYDHPKVRELYKHWTFVSHMTKKKLQQQKGEGKPAPDAPEVLIINGPSLAVKS